MAGFSPEPALGQGVPAYQPAPLSIEFQPESGFYEDSMTVQLLAPGAKIYYTTDGSEPRETEEQRYYLPVTITRTTVVRAIAILKGEKSHVFAATYFLGEPESTFPSFPYLFLRMNFLIRLRV